MDLLGRENFSPVGMIGLMPLSSADAGLSVYRGLEVGNDGRGVLGVRRPRGVTGERQSNEGDDKKAVVIPVVKPSPKDLGRSMSRWKTCSDGSFTCSISNSCSHVTCQVVSRSRWMDAETWKDIYLCSSVQQKSKWHTLLQKQETRRAGRLRRQNSGKSLFRGQHERSKSSPEPAAVNGTYLRFQARSDRELHRVC